MSTTKKLTTPKPFGTVTVGTKGQIVIPKELRSQLKIKPGDQFFVMLHAAHSIVLIRSNDLIEMHRFLSEELLAKKSHSLS